MVNPAAELTQENSDEKNCNDMGYAYDIILTVKRQY